METAPRLTEPEKDRYSRQILISGIGDKGQLSLKEKKVAIIGCGGLGTPVTTYLSGAGVGNITLVDKDEIVLSNLPRQVMYTPEDIGKKKAIVLAERLGKSNADSSLTPLVEEITDENADSILSGHDIVVSCLDNLRTRHIVNASIVRLGLPLVEGAVSDFTGLVTVIIPGKGPCYRCIFPKEKESPKVKSVLGPVAGALGCIEATQALNLLLDLGHVSPGTLYYYDFLRGTTQKVTAPRDMDCPVCKDRHF